MDVMKTAKSGLSQRLLKFNATEVKMKLEREKYVRENNRIKVKKDVYESLAPERKVTYDKPQVEQKTIQQLKDESERAHARLKEIVTALLKRQGLEFQELQDIELTEPQKISIDEIAQKEARAMLEEGGDLSPEKVSDRIVNFAKAISGGDKSKLDLLKKAIDDGFEAARIDFGDELPEICKETYDLTMEKLDAWAKEDEAAESGAGD